MTSSDDFAGDVRRYLHHLRWARRTIQRRQSGDVRRLMLADFDRYAAEVAPLLHAAVTRVLTDTETATLEHALDEIKAMKQIAWSG